MLSFPSAFTMAGCFILFMLLISNASTYFRNVGVNRSLLIVLITFPQIPMGQTTYSQEIAIDISAHRSQSYQRNPYYIYISDYPKAYCLPKIASDRRRCFYSRKQKLQFSEGFLYPGFSAIWR